MNTILIDGVPAQLVALEGLKAGLFHRAPIPDDSDHDPESEALVIENLRARAHALQIEAHEVRRKLARIYARQAMRRARARRLTT